MELSKLQKIENIGWFIMLGAFNSGIGNVLYYYLLQQGGALFALLITYLMPVTTILLGVILLNETIGAGTIVALAFVLVSIYITNRKAVPAHDQFSASSDKINEE